MYSGCFSCGRRARGIPPFWMMLETRVTLKFFAELKSRGFQVRELAEEEWHILLHAYFASLAEVVMHNFPKEAALKYVHTLVSFFNSGWQTVLGI